MDGGKRKMDKCNSKTCKIVKDLKERNDKLNHQYRLRDIRCVTLEQNKIIIDDLEKWLNDEIIRIKNISKKVKVPPYGQEKEYYEKYISAYSMVLEKIKELKEGKE